jgi:hypothetical protein
MGIHLIVVRKGAAVLGTTLMMLGAGATGAQAADLAGAADPSASAVSAQFTKQVKPDGTDPGQGKRLGQRLGAGNAWAGSVNRPAPGSNFVDADGDGVCDNCTGDCDGIPNLDGTGAQKGRNR